MKRLEFLLEELQPRIHHNITVNALMGLSKQHGATRFTIRHGKIHAGDAHHFYHGELTDRFDDNKLVDGAISFDKTTGKHKFYGHDVCRRFKDSQHPLLQKLEDRGAIRGFRGDDFDYDHGIDVS